MLFLTFLSLLPLFEAQLSFSSRTCIKVETFITTQYKITPIDFSDSWFSTQQHFVPRRITKVSFRSKRVYGCCETGYEYRGWPIYGCRPVCFGGCPFNARCTEPSVCQCDSGYHKSADNSSCLLGETLTLTEKPHEPSSSTVTTEIIETTSSKPLCNESACSENETCSHVDGDCVCKNGYHRNDTSSSGCVPKCEKSCQNGDCTAPNSCTCWPHYRPSNDSSECHRECSETSCVFGECNQNGTCVCGHGFFNNGTNCLWAGEDMFSEPDECDCWSKFIWQANVTEGRCLRSCEDNETLSNSDCMNFNECEFYEGYTICQPHIFKCIEAPPTITTTSKTTTMTAEVSTTTAIAHMTADKVTRDPRKFVEIVVLTMAVILPTVVVVMGLWLWNMKRNRVVQLGRYDTMEAEEDNI